MSLIVFEDEHLLVVDKPAGWNTHAPDPYAGEGLYEWLKHREPRWARLAIIHRLDKETSGLLVFGKTTEANRSLTRQFTERSVRKTYVLLTDRRITHDRFTALSAIARAGGKYASVPRHEAGQKAETHFRIALRESGRIQIEAEPVTGRTHQIRVHAAEHGIPILGDVLYGGTSADRVYLHAAELTFRHPVTNAPLRFHVPPDWAANLERSSLIDTRLTDAYRLIHGAADGWGGWYVDVVGDYLLSQSEAPLTDRQRCHLRGVVRARGARGAYHKTTRRQVRGCRGAQLSAESMFGEAAPERFAIHENGLRFEMSFSEGYSIGLFLDQRDNRRRFLANHVAAGFPLFSNGAAGARILNTFAYTCGFSVAAARAGAHSTSLDLSRKYLEWGKRNFALNGIDSAGHDFIYGDAFDWMKRLSKRGRCFEVVVLDPPTFSESKETRFSAERDYGKLVSSALPLVTAQGVLFASTNAARLEPQRFLAVIRRAIETEQRRIVQMHYVPQPPDFPINREEPAYLKTAWFRLG